MADAAKIKKHAATVLSCVEKVSSFASSIDPLFGIVSSLVGIARKGLVDEEGQPMDEEFQEVHTKLESISKKNHKCLKQIQIDEINENYGRYEEYIKHQYAAFNTMVAKLKKDPDRTTQHMEAYEKIYEKDKSDLSLNIFYNGVVGKPGCSSLFGRSLLKTYMDHCDGDLEIMEHRCSHLTHLFHMGLIALMAYTSVTEDDEDEVREKWAQRVADIQAEMQKVLSQCRDKQPPAS